MITTIASTFAAALVLLSYLVGSIPFGLVLTRLGGLGDIRDIGSGNIGATNVLRTGNKALALATLVLDGAKGGGMGLIVWGITGDASLGYVSGFAAFIGHLFPIYLGFEGGKGVATGLGVFLLLSPVVGVLACLTWLATAAISRYSSLASLFTFLLAPLYMVLYNIIAPESVERSFIMLAIVMAYTVWGRHEDNRARLSDGTEGKISFGSAGG